MKKSEHKLEVGAVIKIRGDEVNLWVAESDSRPCCCFNGEEGVVVRSLYNRKNGFIRKNVRTKEIRFG